MTRAHILAGLLLFLAGCLLGREWRDRSADLAQSRQATRQAQAETKAVESARETENEQADKLPRSEKPMSETALRPQPSLMLLWLTCALAISGCAGNGQAVKPEHCPKPLPPPPNVMRSPDYETRLRALLFESSETPTITSAPAKP